MARFWPWCCCGGGGGPGGGGPGGGDEFDGETEECPLCSEGVMAVRYELVVPEPIGPIGYQLSPGVYLLQSSGSSCGRQVPTRPDGYLINMGMSPSESPPYMFLEFIVRLPGLSRMTGYYRTLAGESVKCLLPIQLERDWENESDAGPDTLTLEPIP